MTPLSLFNKKKQELDVIFLKPKLFPVLIVVLGLGDRLSFVVGYALIDYVSHFFLCGAPLREVK